MVNYTVTIDGYNRIKGAANIEDILCLATLIAKGVLKHDATILESNYWFENIAAENCDNCAYHKDCLTCIINE